MDEKKEVRCPISYYIDNGNFEGDLNRIIEFLQKLPIEIKKYYTQHLPFNEILKDINRYEIEIERGYDGDRDEFTVVGYRWETNEEFNKRIEANKKAAKYAKEAAKKRKLALEKQEKENYLKLKAKYG